MAFQKLGQVGVKLFLCCHKTEETMSRGVLTPESGVFMCPQDPLVLEAKLVDACLHKGGFVLNVNSELLII